MFDLALAQCRHIRTDFINIVVLVRYSVTVSIQARNSSDGPRLDKIGRRAAALRRARARFPFNHRRQFWSCVLSVCIEAAHHAI